MIILLISLFYLVMLRVEISSLTGWSKSVKCKVFCKIIRDLLKKKTCMNKNKRRMTLGQCFQ